MNHNIFCVEKKGYRAVEVFVALTGIIHGNYIKDETKTRMTGNKIAIFFAIENRFNVGKKKKILDWHVFCCLLKTVK
ncbi:MAG: hypothetical protein LBG58_11005 [Planctomycetaceae bacterium]|jgi:hypothetical protein|nr:hypothetical protein [Planctomycetaceae bacterium]